MLKTLALTCTLLMSFALAACGSNASNSAAVPAPVPAAANTATPERNVKLTLNNQAEVIVKINNTEAADDFLSLLPLELEVKDYHATEKISYLPRRLNTQNAPAGFDPQAGSFAYYAPWGNLAIFYKDYGYSNNLVELGTISSGLEKLAAAGSDFSVKIERLP